MSIGLPRRNHPPLVRFAVRQERRHRGPDNATACVRSWTTWSKWGSARSSRLRSSPRRFSRLTVVWSEPTAFRENNSSAAMFNTRVCVSAGRSGALGARGWSALRVYCPSLAYAQALKDAWDNSTILTI